MRTANAKLAKQFPIHNDEISFKEFLSACASAWFLSCGGAFIRLRKYWKDLPERRINGRVIYVRKSALNKIQSFRRDACQ